MAHIILWNSLADSGGARALGPYQLGSWLRHNGYVVKVIDFCNRLTTEQLVTITEKYIEPQTLTIGVSGTFWKNENWPPKSGYEYNEPVWVNAARTIIEDKHPNLKWTMGGAQTYLDKTNRWEKFTGHAEDIFLDWLDHIGNNLNIRRHKFDIKDAFQTFQNDDHITSHEVIPIELGRGCKFKCKFCAYDLIGKTSGTYLRDCQSVKHQILHHHEQWGTTRFIYVDDTVNENKEKVKVLADIAQSLPFKVEWIGYIRADLISAKPETEQMLIDSGLKAAFFGIESFEEKSSNLVGKGWSGKHSKDWLLQKRKNWGTNLTWQLGLITGIPGQTPDQLLKDTQWLIDNDMHNWSYFPLWLEPGFYKSEFSINSEKYGFKFPDKSRPWYWENNDWTFDIALEVYNEVTELSKDKMRLGSWAIGRYASLGYQFEELMNPHEVDLPWQEIKIKDKEFVNNYISLSLKH